EEIVRYWRPFAAGNSCGTVFVIGICRNSSFLRRPRICERPVGARRGSVGNCACSGPTELSARSPAPIATNSLRPGGKPSPPYSPPCAPQFENCCRRPHEIRRTKRRNFGLVVQSEVHASSGPALAAI